MKEMRSDSLRRLCLVMLLSAVGNVALAQDKHEYTKLFLTNQQGDLCTMCEADVVCTTKRAPAGITQDQATATDSPSDSSSDESVMLHLYKRGFLGQMSTVLDYFPPTRKFGLYHSRDADVKKNGETASQRYTAKLDLAAKRVDIIDSGGNTLWWIDRTDGSWRGADNALRGQCIITKM